MSKPNNTQLADIASYMAEHITVPQLVQHFDKSMIYSDDEVMVGQWIDKKPIYKKTVLINSLSNNSWNTTPHNVSDIDKIVYVYGGMYNSSNGSLNGPGIWGSGTGCSAYASKTTVELYIYYGSVSSIHKAYITFYYTKTTDNPVDYVPVGGCEPRFQSATTFDQNNPTNCIIRYTSGDGADLLDADSLLLYQKSASTQESTADYVEVNTAKYTYDLFNTITVDSSAGFMNLTPLQNIPMKIVFSKNSIATRVIYGSIPVILHT